MMDQEIFDEDLEFEIKDNRATYCDFLNDDQYVAQFLSVEDVVMETPEFYQGQAVEEMPQEAEEVKEIPKEIVAQEKSSKRRSTFHNFQKHLVTTIRSIVNSTLIGSDPETRECELKFWKVFMNSNKINKTLVTFVLGGITEEDLKKTSGYGFEEILREFSSATIKEAQLNLSEEVLRQLQDANMHEQLKDRRMRNKEEFIVYFRAFLEELINGELDKRMAKCTKLLKREDL